MGLTYAELTDTPLGAISFTAGDEGLKQVVFASLMDLKQDAGGRINEPSLKGLETLSVLMQEMNAYFFGLRKTFSIAVDWGVMDGFHRRVLMRTAEIPYGKVMTYGEIARELGQPGAARAVGRALGANPMPVVIPCHRVIGAGGQLRGYTAGLDVKKYLLTLEGHKFENNRLTAENE